MHKCTQAAFETSITQAATFCSQSAVLIVPLLQAQVQHMTKKYHIYMTMDGRISMAGLSGSSCKYLAEAMKDAVENVKA